MPPSCLKSNKEAEKYMLTILGTIMEINVRCSRSVKGEYTPELDDGKERVSQREWFLKR